MRALHDGVSTRRGTWKLMTYIGGGHVDLSSTACSILQKMERKGKQRAKHVQDKAAARAKAGQKQQWRQTALSCWQGTPTEHKKCGRETRDHLKEQYTLTLNEANQRGGGVWVDPRRGLFRDLGLALGYLSDLRHGPPPRCLRDRIDCPG